MKICVAQTRPVKGDIEKNIENHKKLINIAVSKAADMIVFPELSLTGYEPALAKDLATSEHDGRFDVFQEISDNTGITIGVGVPTKNNAGTCISMIIFHPLLVRTMYSKKYLHPDEEDFFVSGQNSPVLMRNKKSIAFAICYELSVPEHSENAFKCGAEIYIASVVKSVRAVDNAIKTLAAIAEHYAMTVLMSSCIGLSEGEECGGKTSIWNNRGLLAAQLDNTHEGIILIDTDTQEITEKII